MNKILWLLLMACALWCKPSTAAQDTVNLFHKRSLAYSTGIMGIHSFLAPTFEMKTAPLNYRFRLGYYSIGAGLELELGSMSGTFVNSVFSAPVVHQVISLGATYRWDNSWWNFVSRTRPEVKNAYSVMLLYGFKAYMSNTFAFGLKIGVANIYDLRTTETNWWTGPVDKERMAVVGFGGLSIYSYFLRIRKD